SRVAVEAAKLRVVDNNGEEGPGVAQNIVYPLEFTFGVPSDRQPATWLLLRRRGKVCKIYNRNTRRL
ncbi:MAG: hypothetical protein AAFV59_17735, partial [Pseudomonadota bacterium]